jgi:hypothetical protein
LSFKENPPTKETIQEESPKVAKDISKFVAKSAVNRLLDIHIIKKLVREALDELIKEDQKKK